MVAILSLLLFYNTLANKGETIYAQHQGLPVNYIRRQQTVASQTRLQRS